MEFTSKDLIKAMGLAMGDRIKVIFEFTDEEIFEITESVQGTIYLQAINDFYSQAELGDLIGKKFEIISRPKKIGELMCQEYGEKKCKSCPIRAICVDDYTDDTLYNKLKYAHKFAQDQEIYDLLKARLDKEVRE